MNNSSNQKKESVIMKKSYVFALEVVKLYKKLATEQKEWVISRQILRSGTSIGALVKEAEHAQSKKDFINKMNIALKEANETSYWLDILKDSDYISIEDFNQLYPKSVELIRILASIVKTSKNNLDS